MFEICRHLNKLAQTTENDLTRHLVRSFGMTFSAGLRLMLGESEKQLGLSWWTSYHCTRMWPLATMSPCWEAASLTSASSSLSKGNVGHIQEMRKKDPNSTTNFNCSAFLFSHINFQGKQIKKEKRRKKNITDLLPFHHQAASRPILSLLLWSWAGVPLCVLLSPELTGWALTSAININYCKDSCLVLLVRTSAWRVMDGFKLASCQEGCIVFVCDTQGRE